MKKNPLIPKGYRVLRQNEIIRVTDLRVPKEGKPWVTGNPGLKVSGTHAKLMGGFYARKIILPHCSCCKARSKGENRSIREKIIL